MVGSARAVRASTKGMLALVAVACSCLCMLVGAGGASAYTASLTRTTGGIANIEASTLGGGGFGTGYAQAQDGICTLAEEYLTTSGETLGVLRAERAQCRPLLELADPGQNG